MAKLTCLLLVLLVTGCATSSMPPLPERVPPQENCLAGPEPLPQLKTGQVDEIIRALTETAAAYWRLAERHQCLAEFVR